MGSNMRQFSGFIAPVVVAVLLVAIWTTLSIRSEAALGTAGPMVTDAQIDPVDMTATAGGLPVQAFISF